MRGESKPLMTSFKTIRDRSINGYHVASLFPRIADPVREIARFQRHEPNVRVSSKARNGLLQEFLADTQTIGLELGVNDPAVYLVRVAGVGFGETRREPQLEPGYSRIRINDKKGNDVMFRMQYEVQAADEKDREWQKVVVRLEKARINGKRVKLTPEMKREGFTFLSHGMTDILEKARNGEPTTATIRQETPDAACFYDGHHGSGGSKELGCHCKEERAESLDIIFQKGGISVLMPGTGNGNGSEAQAIQISVRNSASRRGRNQLPYQEVYAKMGKSEDNRGESLAISTFILEHLFQIRDIPSLSVLTDSRRKRNIWSQFGQHTVIAEPLSVTVRDGIDYTAKVRRGYRGSGHNSLPLK